MLSIVREADSQFCLSKEESSKEKKTQKTVVNKIHSPACKVHSEEGTGVVHQVS